MSNHAALFFAAIAGLFESHMPQRKPNHKPLKHYEPGTAVKRERTAKEKRRKAKRGY